MQQFYNYHHVVWHISPQCTVSCIEGFTGDDVTYLCNVTSDPIMVDWVPISNTENKSHVPERFVTALYNALRLVYINTMCRYVAADIPTVKTYN